MVVHKTQAVIQVDHFFWSILLKIFNLKKCPHTLAEYRAVMAGQNCIKLKKKFFGTGYLKDLIYKILKFPFKKKKIVCNFSLQGLVSDVEAWKTYLKDLNSMLAAEFWFYDRGTQTELIPTQILFWPWRRHIEWGFVKTSFLII